MEGSWSKPLNRCFSSSLQSGRHSPTSVGTMAGVIIAGCWVVESMHLGSMKVEERKRKREEEGGIKEGGKQRRRDRKVSSICPIYLSLSHIYTYIQ